MLKNKLALKKKSSCQRMNTKMFGQCLKKEKTHTTYQNQSLEKNDCDLNHFRNQKNFAQNEKSIKYSNQKSSNFGSKVIQTKDKDYIRQQLLKIGQNHTNFNKKENNQKNQTYKLKKSKSQIQNIQAQKVKSKEKHKSLNRKKSYILNSCHNHKSNPKFNGRSFSKQNNSTNFSFCVNANKKNRKSKNQKQMQKTKKSKIDMKNGKQLEAWNYLSFKKHNQKCKISLNQQKKTLKLKTNKNDFDDGFKQVLQETVKKNKFMSVEPKIVITKSLQTQCDKNIQHQNLSIANRLNNARKLSESHSQSLNKSQNKLFIKIKTEYEGMVSDLSKIINKEMNLQINKQKSIQKYDKNAYIMEHSPSIISSTHTIPIAKQKSLIKTQSIEEKNDKKLQERQTVKWKQLNQFYSKNNKQVQQMMSTQTNLNIKNQQSQQPFSSDLSSVYLHSENSFADNQQRKLFAPKQLNQNNNKNMANLQLAGLKNKFKIKDYHQEFLQQKQNFSQSWKRQLSKQKQRYNKI